METPLFARVKKPIPWLRGLVAAGLLGTVATAYLVVRTTTPKSEFSNLTVVVASKNLAVQIKANGAIQPVRKINLSPKEAGRIAQLNLEEGDRVKQGELVARMDSQQFQAQVNQYKAALAKSQANLAQKRNGSRPEEISEAKAKVTASVANVAAARAKLNFATEERKRRQTLVHLGGTSLIDLADYISKEHEAKANLDAEAARLREQRESLEQLRNGTRPEEIAQAEAEVAQATAQLQYYQTQLSNTLLCAPFTGTITQLFAQEGDFVRPTTSTSTSDGTTSALIAELSSGLEVEAKVPEASIARIKPGQRVDIRTDAYPDETFEGRVKLIAPTAVQENHITSFRVKVVLQTGLNLLKSGMNVKLSFKGNEIQNAMVVPLAAIVTKKDGQTGVLVSDQNNQAKFSPVTVGSTSGDQVQILQGVSKGERILISPPPGQVIPGVDTLGS